MRTDDKLIELTNTATREYTNVHDLIISNNEAAVKMSSAYNGMTRSEIIIAIASGK